MKRKNPAGMLVVLKRQAAFLFCTLLLPLNAFADSYLEQIQEAAAEVELDPQTKGESLSSKRVAVPANVTSDVPSGLSQTDFESFLQQRYFGSFAFYKKLNKSRKEKVYEAYGKKPQIGFIREKIKNYYLER